jgi:hypothetical protein
MPQGYEDCSRKTGARIIGCGGKLPHLAQLMLSQARRALGDFDNQHDFERMAADILNALGYSDVEPMSPGGGPDPDRPRRKMRMLTVHRVNSIIVSVHDHGR